MNTKLELTIKNTEQRCKLTDLDIDVNITGFLSKTSVTMTFLNETDLDSEGELVFPMPEGAAISGYAVDINGDLVDGVVVEKEKARITFEAEARSVEKPSASIVEHVVGNVFRTRITPLPKKATRVIRVSYVEELSPISKSQPNRSANKNQRDVQWKLSLENTGPLTTLAMSAIITGGGAPRARWDGNTVGSIKPLPDVIGPVAWRFKAENCTIKQGFEIDVPSVASQIVEIDEDKQQYFVLNDDFSSQFNFNESFMQADRVALLWDASKSREVRNEKDMQLIKSYVQKLQNIVIDLTVFRDTSEDLVTFKLVNGNAAPLIEYLNKIPYIGGSNLGHLSVTKTVPVQMKDGEEIVISDTYSYYLMFTDGLHNLSLNSTPEKLEAPVYIFSSSTLSDSTLLKVWARKSGGEYFDLNSASSSTAEIVSKLGNTKFQYLFAEIDGAVVSEIYPSLPSPIQGKQFTIAGKINGQNNATIALNYGYGTRVTRRMKFQIIPSAALKNNLAARYWAQKKIDELQLFPEVAENEAKILSIGQQYNIVTPNSSLIVLESLDQYVKYEIEPPKSLPEVRKNYLEIMKNRKQQQVERDNEKILSVVGFWQRRVAWWNEDVTSPEHSEQQIQHHFQFGFFKPDVYQVAPRDVMDLKQADLTDVLQQKIVEDEEKAELIKQADLTDVLQQKIVEEENAELELIKQADLTDVLQQKIVEDEEKAELELISKREEEITLIVQEMDQIKNIFADLNQLTAEQSYLIDNIEDHAELTPDLGVTIERQLPDNGVNNRPDFSDPNDVADWGECALDENALLLEPASHDDIDTLLHSLAAPVSDAPFDSNMPAAASPVPMSPKLNATYFDSEFLRGGDEGEGGGAEEDYRGSFDVEADEEWEEQQEVQKSDLDGRFARSSSIEAEPILQQSSAMTASVNDSFLMDIEEDHDLAWGESEPSFAGFSYIPEPVPEVKKNEVKKQAKTAVKSKKKEEKRSFSSGKKDMKEAAKPSKPMNLASGESKPMSLKNIAGDLKSRSVLGRGPPAEEAKISTEARRQQVSEKSVLRGNINNNNNNNNNVNMPAPPPPAPMNPMVPMADAPMPPRPSMAPMPPMAPKPSMPPMSRMAPMAASTPQPMMPGQPSMAPPSGYPASVPQMYPSPSVAPVVHAASTVLASEPSADEERFKTISSRRPAGGAAKLEEVQRMAKDSEAIARDVLQTLSQQSAMLDCIDVNISSARERSRGASTEILQAQEYPKKSWFGSVVGGLGELGKDVGGLIGKRMAKTRAYAADPQPTIPTIGFNSAPPMEEKEYSRRRSLRNVEQRIEDVKKVMAVNIDKVLSRGEKLEQLVDRTENLQNEAQTFRKTSVRLRKQSNFAGPGSCVFLLVLPFILLFKFVAWIVLRVRKVMNNSVPVYEQIGGSTTIKYYEPAIQTVTEPVYVTLTLPAVPAELPSDEYFGSLLKAQDEVQTLLHTTAAPEPETDTTVNKTEKVDPKTVWTKWHARQAQTWKEFEQKHFTTGLCFMQKWNEVRVGQLQRVLERELKLIDEEFNSTKTDLAFYKGDERKTASMEVRQKWKSREFYMTALESNMLGEDDHIHAQVLAIQKREHVHEKLSSFYIDAAQYLFARGRIHEGATVLSTLAEIDFENPQLLRAMAMNTDHISQLDRMTEALYRQILKLRPDEPQSYTDLAAVLARRLFRTIKGNTATSTRDSKLLATANEAMELYRQVIVKKWDVRWCQVELTALSEMSRLGHFVQWMGLDQSSMVNIDRRLVQSMMDLDLHVMIRWDTDLTDVEIVVTEPSGEVCNSFHNRTKTGMLSRNFTLGYGPQEYCCRTAQPGRYKINVRLFGAPPAAPPTTVTVRVTTDWGRPVTQVEEYHVVRLNKVKEAVHIMDVNFKAL